MLPNLHRQRYQEFAEVLEQLHQSAVGSQLNAPKLYQSYVSVQRFFQQQIVSLDAGELEPDDESRVRSYQTEISKQLQMLGMDVMFFKRRGKKRRR